MTRAWSTVPTDEDRYRPLYARVLGLRFVNPGGVLCFLFFEGAVALAVLLSLAELVSWWAVLVLPTAVAVMVKLNDVVAEIVIRTAAQVPDQERDRFRRQMEPVVGRARVPATVRAVPGGLSLAGDGSATQSAAPYHRAGRSAPPLDRPEERGRRTASEITWPDPFR
ncbi:hypothetical protein OG767_25445 [Micromonospora sp. NBC_01392]|uniref:hypothetical protein n=1 Tax=Micromonospora sp. NBC_01392 TaxID=2903588 RepID=UPI0032465BA5